MHDSRLDIHDDDDYQDSVLEFYNSSFNYLYNEIRLALEKNDTALHIDLGYSHDFISIGYEGETFFEFENMETLISTLKEHQEFKKLNMTPDEIETSFDEYENRITQMKRWGKNWQA